MQVNDNAPVVDGHGLASNEPLKSMNRPGVVIIPYPYPSPPDKPCGWCGGSSWWWRKPAIIFGKFFSPGAWLCSRCHPEN